MVYTYRMFSALISDVLRTKGRIKWKVTCTAAHLEFWMKNCLIFETPFHQVMRYVSNSQGGFTCWTFHSRRFQTWPALINLLIDASKDKSEMKPNLNTRAGSHLSPVLSTLNRYRHPYQSYQLINLPLFDSDKTTLIVTWFHVRNKKRPQNKLARVPAERKSGRPLYCNIV